MKSISETLLKENVLIALELTCLIRSEKKSTLERLQNYSLSRYHRETSCSCM